MGKQTVIINTNEQNPEPIELIADSIIQISDAFKKINDGRLNRKAIVLLLYSATGGSVNKKDIEIILDTAPKLKDIFLKPQTKTKK